MKKRKTYFGAFVLTGLAIGIGLLVYLIEDAAREDSREPKTVLIQPDRGVENEGDNEAEESATPTAPTESARTRVGPKPSQTDDSKLESQLQEVINLIATDQFEQSLPSLRLLAESHPEDARVHFYLGLAFSKTKQSEDALASYQRALRIFPDYQGASFNLGMLQRRLEQHEAAIATLTHVLKISEPVVKAKAFALRGHSFRALGNYEAAVDDYEQSLKLRPESLSTRRFLALSYSRLPDSWDEAFETINECLQQQPDYRLGLRLRAGLNWSRGNMGEALLDYQQLQALDASRQSRYWELAMIEWQMNRPVRAKMHLKELMGEISSSTKRRTIRALMQLIEGSTLEALDTVNDIDPAKVDRYRHNYLLGHLFLELGDYDKSHAAFESVAERVVYDPSVAAALTAIEIAKSGTRADAMSLDLLASSPNFPKAWSLRADYLKSINEHEEALNALEALREIAPREEVYVREIEWLLTLGNYAAAGEWIEGAKMAAIDSISIQLLDARHLSRTGKHHQASEALARLKESEPENGQIALEVAQNYVRMGRIESALDELDLAIAASPSQANYRYQRASLLRELGRNEEAVEEAKRIIALDQNYDGAQAFLELSTN